MWLEERREGEGDNLCQFFTSLPVVYSFSVRKMRRERLWTNALGGQWGEQQQEERGYSQYVFLTGRRGERTVLLYSFVWAGRHMAVLKMWDRLKPTVPDSLLYAGCFPLFLFIFPS